MVAFKGRLSFVQYLPAKSTKSGIKVWERASPRNGYCHEFQIYTGKVDRIRTEEGLGYRVVKDLTCKMTGKYQLRINYSTCRKALKWWKYLFWFCVDVAIVNSFICMKESINHQQKTRSGRELVRTQLNFRMELARQLIGTYRAARKRKFASNVDNCGRAHWPVKQTKRGRCKQCTSEKRRHEIFIQCKVCQIYLCIDNGCFEKWHCQNMD